MRRFALSFVVVVSFICFVPPLHSQQPTRSPQALALLQQCATAMGANRLDFSIYAEARIIDADSRVREKHLVIRSKGADRVRQDTEFEGRQQTQVMVGRRGKVTREGKTQMLAPHLTNYSLPEHAPAFICSIHLVRENLSVAYIGTETINSRTAHHLEFFAAPKGQDKHADAVEQLISDVHVYLDADSKVIVKTKKFIFSPATFVNHSDWEAYYDDYRNINGVLMPFHIENYANGQKFREVLFTQVDTNASITDADFQ